MTMEPWRAALLFPGAPILGAFAFLIVADAFDWPLESWLYGSSTGVEHTFPFDTEVTSTTMMADRTPVSVTTRRTVRFRVSDPSSYLAYVVPSIHSDRAKCNELTLAFFQTYFGRTEDHGHWYRSFLDAETDSLHPVLGTCAAAVEEKGMHHALAVRYGAHESARMRVEAAFRFYLGKLMPIERSLLVAEERKGSS